MKKLLSIFLICSWSAPAQLGVVQTAGGVTGRFGVTTVTVAMPTAPATGDLLLAMAYYFTGDTFSCPAGWVAAPSYNAGGYSLGIAVCQHFVVAGEPNAYTFSISASDGFSVIVADQQQASTGRTINASNGGYGGATANILTYPLQPTVLGTLPCAVLSAANGSTVTSSPGWTQFTPQVGTYNTEYVACRNTLTTDTTSFIQNAFAVPGNTGPTVMTTILTAPVPASPNPVVTTGGPYYGSATIPVNFDASASYDPYNLALTYAWNFGDGGTGTGLLIQHTYATLGSYTASLTVTDSAGHSTTTTTQVTIQCSPKTLTIGVSTDLGCFVPMPGSPFTADISQSPVDPNSLNITTNTSLRDFGGHSLHADFGGPYGYPYQVCDSSIAGSCPFQAYGFQQDPIEHFPAESDITLFPIPTPLAIEQHNGDPVPTCGIEGDSHSIIIDRATGIAYEGYLTSYCPSTTPAYLYGSTAIWNLNTYIPRTYGVTSVDAAGMSVFAPLVTYGQVANPLPDGTIGHAMRMTAACTRLSPNQQGNGVFVFPATHASGTCGDIYEGMRFRLKPSYDISSYSAQNQVLLRTMKKYGFIIADNGSNMYFQGARDSRWGDLTPLNGITADNFEVVDGPGQPASTDPLYDPLKYPASLLIDAFYHPTGPGPTNTLSAMPVSVLGGQRAALSTSILGGQRASLTTSLPAGSYAFIDALGFFGGSAVVTPAATKTYTMTTRNLFGSSTSTVTVNVTTLPTPTFNGNLAPKSASPH